MSASTDRSTTRPASSAALRLFVNCAVGYISGIRPDINPGGGLTDSRPLCHPYSGL